MNLMNFKAHSPKTFLSRPTNPRNGARVSMPLFGRKKKGESSSSAQKVGDAKDSKMPLFRRQSEKCRKRQQDQELLAQQDPEPRFDLSSCELKEVPAGVYSICKVLQKQVLLMHDNWLVSLSSGGEMEDLEMIRVLDLHNNALKALPDDFGHLINLQLLDLSDNKLKTLPDSFDKLQHLQTLKLKGNRLKAVPDTILHLKCLRTLDISENEIDNLPVHLCHVQALETLVLDVDKIKFPAHETCKKGTNAIMMFLCGQAGIEYEHPSKYWLKIEAAMKAGISSSVSDQNINLSQIEANMTEGLQAYQSVLDQKRKDAEELEKFLYANDEAQAQLAAQASVDHKKIMSSMTKNQDQISKDLDFLTNQKDNERREFFKYLTDHEKSVGNLLAELLDYNAKAKETEQLLEELEQERMKEDDLFAVRWEELQNLRKQEVLDAMQVMLTEFALIEEARQEVVLDKDETARDALEQETLDVGQMESLLYHKEHEHKQMVKKLAKEEELQKAAFEALIYSRDSAHSRIRSQVAVIEAELAQITKLEMEQSEKRTENEFNIVCEQRIALSALLSQLLEEKEIRQTELKKRLIEMEQQREDGQTDYWLVQYQRLLDWKPQALIDRESQLEKVVKEILKASGASDYIPVFARHRITIETMKILTDKDLTQMGVHELGLRRMILKNIDCMSGEVKSAPEKLKALLREPTLPVAEVAATAPPESQPLSLPPSLLERQSSITARGMNSECSICMDNQSDIIFLTCGHVCCCSACAKPLSECPLCRASISAKIRLTIPAQGS